MATSVAQDSAFINHMIPSEFLEEAIIWIQRNLSPEDVFTDTDLRLWAVDNGFLPDQDES